ncbi:EXS-domain-containing protein [Laetiporus sulphureus 93-53]|uniref:EXS-domain-containing protein n=1 Tax=Laetiporus sulphureus 93-53 TaxID=1314785 RepID=A0A165GY99_9APHY|nr:EXS-domain-containing protein [Laetiporus sulphureus 93-53]KZT10993.1 EXS-domain-containing protein [Laetiporus sulphureus 93-53]
MSDDTLAEPPFSATFPLPFRVLTLAGLGILGWAANLHGLRFAGLDARSVLDLDHYDTHRIRTVSSSPLDGRVNSRWRYSRNSAALYKPVYKLFTQYALWTVATWSIYRYATFGDISRVDAFKFIPAVAILVVLMILISPFHIIAKAERDKFLYSICRCLFPSRRIHFADVVFADVCTSFAKVLGDVWLSFCMLMPGGSLIVTPPQDGWTRWILPTLMSLPYAVRFRQCLVEYRSPTNESQRPLFNAMKYATSFPVIYLSAAQRIVVSELVAIKGEAASHEVWHGEHALFRLWLFAAVVNSLYSFWWDVTNDWGFDLLVPRSSDPELVHRQSRLASSLPRPLLLFPMQFRTASSGKQPPSPPADVDGSKESFAGGDVHTTPNPRRLWHPYGLRHTLLFPLPVYPFAIIVDLVLRLTWSAKLSSHLHAYAEGDVVMFCFEFAEVVRRWMWVFIRVEWEVVNQDVRPRSPPPTNRLESIGEDEYEMVSPKDAAFASSGG